MSLDVLKIDVGHVSQTLSDRPKDVGMIDLMVLGGGQCGGQLVRFHQGRFTIQVDPNRQLNL